MSSKFFLKIFDIKVDTRRLQRLNLNINFEKVPMNYSSTVLQTILIGDFFKSLSYI